MDEKDIIEILDESEDAAGPRVHWISVIYDWMAETHTNLDSLIAWVAYLYVIITSLTSFYLSSYERNFIITVQCVFIFSITFEAHLLFPV